jgi:hypothetical protein
MSCPLTRAFRLLARLRVLGWSAGCVRAVSASALCVLPGPPLLSRVSRGGSVGAAYEQPVGTAYQEMSVFEGFEYQAAGVPFETR